MSDEKEDVVRTLRADLSDPCYVCGKIVWWNTKLDPPEPDHMVIDFSNEGFDFDEKLWPVCGEAHGRHAIVLLTKLANDHGLKRKFTYMRGSHLGDVS